MLFTISIPDGFSWENRLVMEQFLGVYHICASFIKLKIETQTNASIIKFCSYFLCINAQTPKRKILQLLFNRNKKHFGAL